MGWRTITVQAHEQVVAQRDGEVVAVLGPGRHPRAWRTGYHRIDVREQLKLVAGQELLTADGVTIKVSATVRWQVAEPIAYVTVATDPEAVIHLAVQVSLREELAGLTAEQVLREGRGAVGRVATDAARTAGSRVGIAVLDVVLKDVVLPPELRLAYAQVVLARQRGQAQLEQARAETAALRSLANGAQLLEDHPALARLRIVQAAPPGSQLKITVE